MTALTPNARVMTIWVRGWSMGTSGKGSQKAEARRQKGMIKNEGKT
jgi:hypothetical protein